MIKKVTIVLTLVLLVAGLVTNKAAAQNKALKLIFIRHAEKPDEGDNLSCAGFNRALKLPAVLKAKFGVPDRIYIPAVNSGKSTSRGRMFQTAAPFAIKYNININSKFDEEDTQAVAENLQGKTGTILIVWEHNEIKQMIKALGISTKNMKWPDDDFDSIWIVTYKNGKPVLSQDKEGITPAAGCSF